MAGYIALVHKDKGTSYGVSFPDVPGCISAGDTLEEALVNAAEALAGHIALMREDGDTVPAARSLAAITKDPDFADELEHALVHVVIPRHPIRAVASSAIRGLEYDEKHHELRVQFRSGEDYTYLEVPAEEYAALETAKSKGRHIALRIKPYYRFRQTNARVA